jgi:hypothetical protein
MGRLEHHNEITVLYMFSAFRLLVGCEIKVARAIFYTFEAFTMRRKLLEEVAGLTGHDQDKRLIEKLIKAANRSNEQRQMLMHGMLVKATKDGPTVFLKPRNARDIPVTVTRRWLDERMHVVTGALQEAREAYEALCEKRGLKTTPDL